MMLRLRHYRHLKPMMFLLTLLCVFAGGVLLRQMQILHSAELSPLETRVLGETRWLRGGPAALRVIVTDHRTAAAVRADVSITLTPTADVQPVTYRLFSGRTNVQGTLDAQFTVPQVDPGAYNLTVKVASRLGLDEVTQPIQIDEAVQIMLTSDKPLYQPGQTMHLRALAMNLATRVAVVRTPITFEVEDARGNKVFKEQTDLSSFGIAGVDFTLADEVNMGNYTLRAVLPQGQTEKTVRVERYVLPKFKVALTTDKPYYQPGELVHGTVQADYFFGKPVAHGTVTIEVSTVDIGVTKLAELSGTTDANGTYKFDYQLPAAFVGQPFEQGKAVVEFHTLLTDTAEHLQESFTALPVVKDPILLAVVPESRALVPGLRNRVFLAAASPNGTPLKQIALSVTANNGKASRLTTDALGLAVYEFIPGKDAVTLKVQASTPDGATATVQQSLDVSPTQEGIILRTSQSLARVGDRINVAAISSTKRGTIYLDVVRNKQTILTRALPVRNGQADINLPISDEMVGTLTLHAYKILPNEEIIRDTQLLIVMPAQDLTIGVTADKQEYRPGEDAVLSFTVTDQQRHPVLAALGVAIVDESVFALSEMQPGLEKIYFTLEKELMEPKYEVHGLTPTGILLPPVGPHPILLRDDKEKQQAAEMLFATVPAPDFDFQINTYLQRWEKMKADVLNEMELAHNAITQALGQYRDKHKSDLAADKPLTVLVDEGLLKADQLKDRWGTAYRVDLHEQKIYGWFTLQSAGPDAKWQTADDVNEENLWRRMRGVDGDVIMLRDGVRFQKGDMNVDGIAMPMMANGAPMMIEERTAVTASPAPPAAAGGTAPVRVREYFPETMYWNPSVLTDARGHAEIRIPMADSITTWRMSLLANTPLGLLGSTTAPLRVFQPFFADIDLPVSLTQGDTVGIPVAVYNYLPGAQDVTLRLDAGDWFTLQGEAVQQVHLEKDDVKVVYFPIAVTQIGHFPLTVHADGTGMSDAIRRSIDILPNGQEVRSAINDRLEGTVEKTVTIPASAIEGASAVWVKLYPGTFSQVVEGLDGILRMPNGCFEQTSSTTYPNVLVLDYLKATKRINPELQMKAEQYINTGYQRLVTFECKNGGFSWFGDEPAHQILTAYGLLEFTDMARVHEVDPRLISRTQNWLAGQQQGDGTWNVTEQGIAEGIINRQTGALRSTAYIAWALAESGYRGPQLQRAVSYVKAHRTEAKDPYTLAIMLNLLTRVERDSDVTTEVAQALIGLAKVDEKSAYWESDTQTFTGAKQQGADLETTGLAAFGLVKWGRNSGFTNKVLTRLVQSKDSFGTWSSTQGTVWSLKALLLASATGAGGGKGTVNVEVNNQHAATIEITEQNSDVVRQVDVSGLIRKGDSTIKLSYTGESAPLYQIVTRYYQPWELAEQHPAIPGPLSIAVQYDKTTLAQNDTATVTATVTNTTDAVAEMPLIDLGLPPGFTLDASLLDDAVQAKTISKYTVAARQVIIYLEKLAPGQSVTLTYRLRAKYPIKARTPQSRAYPYYNPESETISAPQEVIVQ